jgi:protein gp37
MGERTGIEWCDHTFNPWRGCTEVSPGCDHCYAEAVSRRNPAALGVWGPSGRRVVAAEPYWRLPLKWDREAAAAGRRRRVFCAGLADVFEDRPGLTLPRCRLFRLIHLTPYLDWLLLTRRPEGVTDRLDECSTQEDRDHGDDGRLGVNDGACLARQWKYGSPMPNAWLGVSVEDQRRAGERIPHLLRLPARVRFLSCEPLLGPVDLRPWLQRHDDRCDPGRVCGGCNPDRGRLHWVIVGGESGPHARPCRIEWVRSLIRQCRAAGVAVFVKQLGGHVIDRNDAFGGWDDTHWPETLDLDAVEDHIHGYREDYQGADCRVRLVDRKGGDPGEWPPDLRVREVPC